MAIRRSAQAWAELVDELDESELTVGEFAARKGVTARTLAWWRWKVRQSRIRRDEQTLRFVELAVEPEAASAPLRLRFERLGIEIEVDRGFDADLLRAVVGALC